MDYSLEERERLMLAVSERMENGESFEASCSAEGVPRTTIRRWVDKVDDAVSSRYARARETLLDFHEAAILAIVDNVSEDTNAIAKARLQIDSRKWLLARLMNKRLGDKIQAEHTGQDGGPMQFSVVTGVERKDD
jgi:uncharacterized protein (UPF0147 family)